MIWYLLYPLRGTTEAPVLAPNHPLRVALTRYGRYAARHALATLLISVAVAAVLMYPFPYLYTTDFTNGASNIPLHVWTDAQKLDASVKTEPDVIMRTLWVHGSYMKALEKDVLLGALELQDELLGPTRNFSPRRAPKSVTLVDPALDLAPDLRDQFHVINGLSNQSWFFHSPLLYWSCDADRITRDPDVVATVNHMKNRSTNANVTLRHSIVFSGKRFEDRRLVAADTLVITLIHLRDSPVGKLWEKRAEALASRPSSKWDIYQDGKTGSSQLYEFQFRPISAQDKVLLALAYTLTVLYFCLSLSKIRAVKSKFGLIVTVISQVALSILSSFTVCAIFMIDLSRIPRAAYPLVILAMSLENIFRLINAVILTSPEHPTSSRIGHAFGETGHVALAGFAQNLLILWGLSKLVSPGVAAFCTFAAIAIVFDLFYLSTFFLAVLSVDVRRTELSDAFEKASSRYGTTRGDDAPPPRRWTDAVLQGRPAVSTRIAGTLVMTLFVLVAQWHFFENELAARSLGDLFHSIWGTKAAPGPTTTGLAQIHQARSPTSWLRLQDHETAREVIRTVKPWASSYIARVYDPLIVVLRGSSRLPAPERRLLPALYDFLQHQLTPFIVSVLLVVLAVRLLMNYLLWDELAQSKVDDDTDDEPLLSVKPLPRGHVLDVAMLAASSDGHVVSVGLDRKIRMWNVRSSPVTYTYSIAGSRNMLPDLFPVLSLAIDPESNWVAVLSNYYVRLWSLTEQRWGSAIALDMYGQKPVAFFFGPAKEDSKARSVIVVRKNGTMVELGTDDGDSTEYVLCKTPLMCAVSLAEKPTLNHPHPRMTILTLSRRGCIHRVTRQEEFWLSEEVKLPCRDERDAHEIVPFPAFSAYLVVRSQAVDLVDLHSSRVIHSFQTEPIKLGSFKSLHSSGPSGLRSLTLAYTAADSRECVLQTYLPDREDVSICFCDSSAPTTRTCCPWTNTKEIRRRVADPGTWETLANGCVVGVRRKQQPRPSSPAVAAGLRHRGARSHSDARPSGPPAEDVWEVWLVSLLGGDESRETRPLLGPEERAGLIISELGPMVRIGSSSVAVAFGNAVKVVSAGHERFETSEERASVENLGLSSRRRKTGAAAARQKQP